MPKVSVCIPVYGVEKYIERCARSLFEQTMQEGIEFIFVNDCTKDKSIEILEQVLAEYPQRRNQTKIIHHKVNRGLLAARETGLAHANGDYIIHCDSDDWVDLNMYEIMYNKAVSTDADMVYCDYYADAIKSKKIIKQETCTTSSSFMFRMCSNLAYASLWTKLYKRNICRSITLLDKNVCMNEDFIRNFYHLCKSNNLCHISVPFYHYFVNVSSISKNWKYSHVQDLLKIRDLIETEVSCGQCAKSCLMAYEQIILYVMLRHPEIVSKHEFLQYKRKFLNCIFVRTHMPLSKKLFLLAGMINYSITCFILFLMKARIG
ncbi:MAG: glycosyltransferase family 2 protein [Lentisphaeria bacterium]|nr:glycosyltransferase family 2 protein [Lentisphaeria bacterium]